MCKSQGLIPNIHEVVARQSLMLRRRASKPIFAEPLLFQYCIGFDNFCRYMKIMLSLTIVPVETMIWDLDDIHYYIALPRCWHDGTVMVGGWCVTYRTSYLPPWDGFGRYGAVIEFLSGRIFNTRRLIKVGRIFVQKMRRYVRQFYQQIPPFWGWYLLQWPYSYIGTGTKVGGICFKARRSCVGFWEILLW